MLKNDTISPSNIEQLAPDGRPFELTELHNNAGMSVTLMDWGATWISAIFPLKSGEKRELLLGCQTPADYLNQSAYFGATVGRYANRIANAQITVEGETLQLVPNQGVHQLHGGPEGFHARRWQKVKHDERQVTYQLHSPDGDQGFPGNLTAEVQYLLTEDNRLEIHYQAQVDKTCPVNLTNHAYFNLDGEGHDVRAHGYNCLPINICRSTAMGSQPAGWPVLKTPAWISARKKPWHVISCKTGVSNGLKVMTMLICCIALVVPQKARQLIYGHQIIRCK